MYPKQDDLSQIKRQTKQLVRQSRRKDVLDDDDDTDDEWETEPETIEVPAATKGRSARRIRDVRPLAHV